MSLIVMFQMPSFGMGIAMPGMDDWESKVGIAEFSNEVYNILYNASLQDTLLISKPCSHFLYAYNFRQKD